MSQVCCCGVRSLTLAARVSRSPDSPTQMFRHNLRMCRSRITFLVLSDFVFLGCSAATVLAAGCVQSDEENRAVRLGHFGLWHSVLLCRVSGGRCPGRSGRTVASHRRQGAPTRQIFRAHAQFVTQHKLWSSGVKCARPRRPARNEAKSPTTPGNMGAKRCTSAGRMRRACGLRWGCPNFHDVRRFFQERAQKRNTYRHYCSLKRVSDRKKFEFSGRRF